MSTVINVLVADDHRLFRAGLVRMLADLAGIHVLQEADSGEATLAALAQALPDVLILDLTMPGLTGVPLIEKLRTLYPALPILILSMHDEPVTIRHALKAGAAGYITKDADPDILQAAIVSVSRGEYYVAPSLAVRLALGSDGEGHLVGQSLSQSLNQSLSLSKREKEVLSYIAQGLPLIDIANLLCLSPKTVTTHKANLMVKLGIKNNADLIRYASEQPPGG